MPSSRVGESNYPTLKTIADLVRSFIDDSGAGATGTPGEGQIVTDDPTISPFFLPQLNSGIREIYRELRNSGVPTLIKDNFIFTGLPVIFNATPNPAIQCQISPQGFYDGNQIFANFPLPSDCLMVEKMWERQTGHGSFRPMTQSQEGLEPRSQISLNHHWEWRGDAIWLPGSTQSVDLRMRYKALFPVFFGDNIDFKTTQIPIYDCEEAVAYKTAYKIAFSLGAPQAATLKIESVAAMQALKLAYVRRAQSINYRRQKHGGENVGF